MNRHSPLIAITCAALGSLGSGCSSPPVAPPTSDVPLADLVDLPPIDTGTDAGTDAATDAATDAGTDVATDAGTDAAVDATGGCDLPGYGLCARGTSCVIGHCPDGTPVSCFCTDDGRPLCTGACPPSDAGVTCGQARGDGTVTGCAPASLVLDPSICRCILGYYWDGRACASSANCHCFSRCEQLYPSREACVTAYARCG